MKDFINAGGVKEVKKPKAFVVKKAKTAEPEVKEETKKEETEAEVKQSSAPKVEVVKTKPQSRLEIVRRAPQNLQVMQLLPKEDLMRTEDFPHVRINLKEVTDSHEAKDHSMAINRSVQTEGKIATELKDLSRLVVRGLLPVKTV